MKKRILSAAMGLCLAVTMFPATASAESVCMSPQSLTVDGEYVSCQKYNIDGYNYFMLRDIAAALSGTDYQFDVSYDAASNSVKAVSGQAYTGEIPQATGKDKSSTAVRSQQSIMVDGVYMAGTSVYNIGGNNYFKLRDLGDIFGFTVDYDQTANAAEIFTVAESDDVLTGEYADSWSQRADAYLDYKGDNTYWITVNWGNSWNETVVWNMTGSYDAASGRLTYTDCVKSDVITDDNGEGSQTQMDLPSQEGYFDVVINGSSVSLKWTGSPEESCQECVFELENSAHWVESQALTLDDGQLPDGTYNVNLYTDTAVQAADGSIQLKASIDAYDIYDIVDIANLNLGDMIQYQNEWVEVNEIYRDDEYGWIDINGGFYEGGFSLASFDDTNGWRTCTEDDYPAFFTVAENQTLKIKKGAVLTDGLYGQYGDTPTQVSFDKMLSYLQKDDYWNSGSTTVTVENGYVTEVNRIWVP